MTTFYLIGAFTLAVVGTVATFTGGALATDRYSEGAALAVTAVGIVCLTMAFGIVGVAL